MCNTAGDENVVETVLATRQQQNNHAEKRLTTEGQCGQNKDKDILKSEMDPKDKMKVFQVKHTFADDSSYQSGSLGHEHNNIVPKSPMVLPDQMKTIQDVVHNNRNKASFTTQKSTKAVNSVNQINMKPPEINANDKGFLTLFQCSCQANHTWFHQTNDKSNSIAV